MLKFERRILLSIFTIIFVYCLITYTDLLTNKIKHTILLQQKFRAGNESGNLELRPHSSKIRILENEEIVVAVVVCGNRMEESLVMIKSAVIFHSNNPLRVIIITDPVLQKYFHIKLKQWKLNEDWFSYEIHNLTFPNDQEEAWRRLFKPCASQRLFLPDVLSHLDSILYVDTDTLFLSPLSEIWKRFHYMNSSQIAALAPEHEDPNIGWYNRFARHPFYGKLGVNSGVMLMNLTRMREFKWVDYLVPIYKEYKSKLAWGDQDIINIIFHYHPDKLYIYPCRFNYRPDHCMYMSTCESAERNGIIVLHGSRRYFHVNKQPIFRAIYETIDNYEIGNDMKDYLLKPLMSRMSRIESKHCGVFKEMFIKNMLLHLS